MLLLFQYFRFKRFLVYRSNFRPLRGSKKRLCPFQFHDLDIPFLAFCTADLGLRSKLSLFKCLSSKKKYGFQASLSYRRPNSGILYDTLEVPYGNNACFTECSGWRCRFGFVRSLSGGGGGYMTCGWTGVCRPIFRKVPCSYYRNLLSYPLL